MRAPLRGVVDHLVILIKDPFHRRRKVQEGLWPGGGGGVNTIRDTR